MKGYAWNVCNLLLVSACLGLSGCTAVKATIPMYPPLEPGAPASVLQLDNQIPDFALSLRGCLYLAVTLDGFSPTDKSYLPEGTNEIRVAGGSHVIEHSATWCDNSIYYFNRVSMHFETEPGKTYLVRFTPIFWSMKPGYHIEYEGWPNEDLARWPKANRIANPLF